MTGDDVEDTAGSKDTARSKDTAGSKDTADIDDELAADDGSLSSALRTLLQAPEDIGHRVADTVSDQLLGRSTAGTALDLLGLGVRTLAFFLTDAADGADRNDDHRTLSDDGREVAP